MAITINLQPITVNLKLYAGDAKTIQLRLWEDKEKTVPMNITGFTFKAQIRKERKSDDTSKWEVPVTPHIGTPTYIDVHFSKETTEVAPAACVWDIQVTDGLGNPMTWITGEVEIEKDVTR